jgi:hypothetical protein
MSVKISDLPAKGSALASTDLIEISEVSGGSYVSKRVTGANVLGNFVPYTGATANVNLGTFHLDAAKGTFSHSGSTDTLTATHSSGSGIGLLITKGGNNEGLKVNKTSGSGNAATIIGTLEATTFVKTGGTSTQFLMADGSVSTANSKFAIIGNPAVTTAASLTRFISPFQTTNSTTENLRSMVIPFAVTITKFYIGTAGSQPATGSSVFTLRKNGVATSIVVTIPAGSASGVFSDILNSVSFVAGDLISIEQVNNASTNAAQISQITISE